MINRDMETSGNRFVCRFEGRFVRTWAHFSLRGTGRNWPSPRRLQNDFPREDDHVRTKLLVFDINGCTFEPISGPKRTGENTAPTR